MTNHHLRQMSRGGAALEFLLCLPVLILLAFPVVDLARVLQADTIMTNLAREGANLASRTDSDAQEIMESLAATALPLNMRSNGMIHITKILAYADKGITRNVVIAQHRWNGGSYVPRKGIWTCGEAGSHWDGAGNCAGLPVPAAAPTANVMSGMLHEGDVVYLVEVFYRFPLLFDGHEPGGGIAMSDIDPDLYAMAVF